jgi:hypothetical protein
MFDFCRVVWAHPWQLDPECSLLTRLPVDFHLDKTGQILLDGLSLFFDAFAPVPGHVPDRNYKMGDSERCLSIRGRIAPNKRSGCKGNGGYLFLHLSRQY